MNKLLLISLIIIIPTSLIADEESTCYQGQRWQAETYLQSINTALQFFKLDVGRYPTEEEGFDILVQGNKLKKPDGYSSLGGYLNENAAGAKDPRGSPFQYSLEPTPHFYSVGKDKKVGGTGENEDIHLFYKDHLFPRPMPSCG